MFAWGFAIDNGNAQRRKKGIAGRSTDGYKIALEFVFPSLEHLGWWACCCPAPARPRLSVSDELTVTAYESLVTLHPRHVAHFMLTGASCHPDAVDRGVVRRQKHHRHPPDVLSENAVDWKLAKTLC